MPSTTQPAVFLDRDGTLIEEAGYLHRIDQLVLYPWSVDAIRELNDVGFTVVVVTNQAGIAKGILDEAFLEIAHRRIDERMASAGAHIAAYYYCPHHPDAVVAAYRQNCDCRKPRPGLVLRAVRELGLDLSRSFVVGDRWRDVKVGNAVGARSILVKTGYGATEAQNPPDDAKADAVVGNLLEAATWILRETPAELTRSDTANR